MLKKIIYLGLEIGAKTIWITKFIVIITFPISYPIGKLLDKILGKECISYNRTRMIELIKMTTNDDNECAKEELKIAAGAILMSDKTVFNIMTKINVSFININKIN